MSITRATKQINAPVESVFNVISNAEMFSTAVPHITHVEFLSDQKSGVGTRFRETRLIKGREAKSTLEVTELIPNKNIKLVSDEGGTEWISELTTRENNGGCELAIEMEARAYKFLSKLVNPFIKGMIAKAIEDDFESIKQYCESNQL